MAEYGLYGAMVRHSLPLPETILKSVKDEEENNAENAGGDQGGGAGGGGAGENRGECVAPWLLG